ncbi:hypothetical protein LMG28138_01317 [Pararobbsia alpina]|uniref:Uncharacterized protein n=1 Tax=Pararobbsia alpina TaxID=621374 RepID=A0A6S7AYC2_9BURK|nr:hypothetical protein LMG28138_01317 [Pararobbsia alpina]
MNLELLWAPRNVQSLHLSKPSTEFLSSFFDLLFDCGLFRRKTNLRELPPGQNRPALDVGGRFNQALLFEKQ